MSKIYKFAENGVAKNPDVYEHILEASKQGSRYCVKVSLFVAKNEIGYVVGTRLESSSAAINLLPGTNNPCYYYSLAYGSPKRAILGGLIDLTKYASLEAYPICIIVKIGNLFVDYCQNELSDGLKVG